MKVSQQVQAIFNAAYNEAKLRGHEYLTPEHILYASLSFEQVRSILEACEADIEHIKLGMEAYFEQKIPAVKEQEPIQTAGFQSVIERAVLQSQGSGKLEVGIPEILVSARLVRALALFEKRMPGYASEEAVLVGVESRTSSPVRVPRDPLSLQSPDMAGLYPTGEGAGYAGGIVSAALDGMRVARAIATALSPA